MTIQISIEILRSFDETFQLSILLCLGIRHLGVLIFILNMIGELVFMLIDFRISEGNQTGMIISQKIV